MIVRKKGVIARSKQAPLVQAGDELDNRKEERRERKVRHMWTNFLGVADECNDKKTMPFDIKWRTYIGTRRKW